MNELLWVGEMSFSKSDIKGLYVDDVDDADEPYRIIILTYDNNRHVYATNCQYDRNDLFVSLLCELGLA